MLIQAHTDNFKMPTRASDLAGGFDIYTPAAGCIHEHAKTAVKVPLGFATAIPERHVALLLPRSGVGAKQGVELNNTCGVIDADYRGQWFGFLRTKNGQRFTWNALDRLLQFVIVPVVLPELIQVGHLPDTQRDHSGFGSTGN